MKRADNIATSLSAATSLEGQIASSANSQLENGRADVCRALWPYDSYFLCAYLISSETVICTEASRILISYLRLHSACMKWVRTTSFLDDHFSTARGTLSVDRQWSNNAHIMTISRRRSISRICLDDNGQEHSPRLQNAHIFELIIHECRLPAGSYYLV